MFSVGYNLYISQIISTQKTELTTHAEIKIKACDSTFAWGAVDGWNNILCQEICIPNNLRIQLIIFSGSLFCSPI